VALSNEEPSSILFTEGDASTEKNRGGLEIISESIIKTATEGNNSEEAE
jgi:hypothetical protein